MLIAVVVEGKTSLMDVISGLALNNRPTQWNNRVMTWRQRQGSVACVSASNGTFSASPSVRIACPATDD